MLPRYYFRTDPELSFDHQENFPRKLFLLKSEKKQVPIWTNELGCFDQPFGDTRDYILMVGDSFTFSYSRYQDKWGAIAEKLLDQRVLKCGVGGFGLRQALAKASRVIEKVGNPPKLIIVGYHIGSDLVDDYMIPNGTVIDGYRSGPGTEIDLATGAIRQIPNSQSIKQEVKNFLAYFTCDTDCGFSKRARFWLRLHSATYNLVVDALKSVAGTLWNPRENPVEAQESSVLKSPEAMSAVASKTLQLQQIPYYQGDDFPWIARAWEKHLANIKAFQNFAGQHNVKILFVLFPDKHQVSPSVMAQGEYYRAFQGFDLEAPNRRLRKFLEEEKILYLDLLPDFRRVAGAVARPDLTAGNLYLKTDGHLNERGDHLAGALLADAIVTQRLITLDRPQGRLDTIHRRLSGFELR
jgi:hypothetical protein